jgi:flagellar P-ring protein precursor FlgI
VVHVGAGKSLVVNVPADRQNNITAFISELEGIQVQSDVIAKVVLNEKTGTVVAGTNVKIMPVTISHGNLNINISSYPIISQPEAFSKGSTVVFNNLVPSVDDQDSTSTAIAIRGASTVQEVAGALNSLKVSPRDIIAIFQALKEAGALVAELVII